LVRAWRQLWRTLSRREQGATRGGEREAIFSQDLSSILGGQGAEPARIDRVGLVVAQRVLDPVKPARHERVDDRDGMTSFGQGRRPMEMKHARRFDEHEQGLVRGDVSREQIE